MFRFVLVSFVTVQKTMLCMLLMARFRPETKRCSDSSQKRNERTQSTFFDPIVMLRFVLVSFVTVQKIMLCMHLMPQFGPKMKRCTDSGQKRNERTQSTFLDPIVMFRFVLVSFVTVQKIMLCMHLMPPFGPKMKRCTDSGQKRNERTQSTFLDPIVMFRFVLVSFLTVQKTMLCMHLMPRLGPETKRCTDLGLKRNERTQSTFLDPIVMFRFVLVSFITVQKTMLCMHLMARFGPETKRTHPIHFLDPIVMFRFVLVSFVIVQITMLCMDLMPRFVPETKRCTDSGQKRNDRTQSTFLDPVVMFRFVLVSFVTAQKTMLCMHLMARFGPETK